MPKIFPEYVGGFSGIVWGGEKGTQKFFWGKNLREGKRDPNTPRPFCQRPPGGQSVRDPAQSGVFVGNKLPPHNGLATRIRRGPVAWHGGAMAWHNAALRYAPPHATV